LSTAFSAFTFPFAETVLFLPVLGNLRKKSNPYKVYLTGLLLAGFMMLVSQICYIAVLGTTNYSILMFQTYIAVRLINIGNFLQRIEILISVLFMLGGFIKCCVCLYAAVKGIAMVFNIDDYHKIVAPFGLLMSLFSIIIYSSSMEMIDWIKVYGYYAIPFQIILPVIIWITAEVKHRSTGKNERLQKNIPA
jgi:spore germination protein KB